MKNGGETRADALVFALSNETARIVRGGDIMSIVKNLALIILGSILIGIAYAMSGNIVQTLVFAGIGGLSGLLNVISKMR